MDSPPTYNIAASSSALNFLDLDLDHANIESLPVIDVSALVSDHSNKEALNKVVNAIRDACCNWGFFYITNHGVSVTLQKQIESVSRRFFALSTEQKNEISISKGGKSWRGYFSMGGEHTNGKSDLKEGINFGVEHSPNDPRVEANLPLHGPNLWSTEVSEMEAAFTEYMNTMEKLGHAIIRGVSLSLGLSADHFLKNFLPNSNYRCISLNYPPDHEAHKNAESRWGVGEHCDYGLLTILKQDNSGGLEVKSVQNVWTEATPIENTFVCNIGDMMQTITNGLYRSTPHRVRNIYTGKDRFSCPFFLDPSWDSEIKPIPMTRLRVTNMNSSECAAADYVKRAEKVRTESYCGKYGDYATSKFSKSFPGSK